MAKPNGDKSGPRQGVAAAGAPKAVRVLSAAKQRRLDALMSQNTQGRLNAAERRELAELVRETEELAVHNARRLAGQD